MCVGSLRTVRAAVPLANMFQYVSTLRSLSKGRAQYSMEVLHIYIFRFTYLHIFIYNNLKIDVFVKCIVFTITYLFVKQSMYVCL